METVIPSKNRDLRCSENGGNCFPWQRLRDDKSKEDLFAIIGEKHRFLKEIQSEEGSCIEEY